MAASVAHSQDTPKPKTVTPPVLTDAQKLIYFKANSEYQTAASQAKEADQTAQQKQAALQSAAKLLVDACGKDFGPSLNTMGDPICVAKPKPEAKK